MINQKIYYSKKNCIMLDKGIKNEWIKFIGGYGKYFKSNEEKWYDTLDKCRKYIDENHKRPSSKDKNVKIKKIGVWICTQNVNYLKKIQIMKNKKMRKHWKKFTKDYF